MLDRGRLLTPVAGAARRPRGRPRARLRPPPRASSTATSSPPTCSSARTAACASPTSAWPGPSPRRRGPSRPASCSAPPATPRPSRPGASRSTARRDVYSLALMLVEAVTGEVPFAADTTVATLMNRLDQLMPVSADLGPLAAVLERAGRPDPAERSTPPSWAGRSSARPSSCPARPRCRSWPRARRRASRRRHGHRVPGRATAPPTAAAGATPVRAAAARGSRPAPAVTRPGRAARRRRPSRTGEPPAPHAPPGSSCRRGRPPGPAGTLQHVPHRAGRAAVAGDRRRRRVARCSHGSPTPTYPVRRPRRPRRSARPANRIATYGWEVTEVSGSRTTTQPLDVVFQHRRRPRASWPRASPSCSTCPTAPRRPCCRRLVGTAGRGRPRATLADARPHARAWSGSSFSETAPVNAVVVVDRRRASRVPEGATVDKGSTVDVIVSAGPEPRTIPQLVGLPPDQVEQAAQGLGLVPSRGRGRVRPPVAAGLVAASQPAPGTQVARGSTVAYRCRRARTSSPCRTVRLDLQQATATLDAAGLAVGPIVGDPSRAVLATSAARPARR